MIGSLIKDKIEIYLYNHFCSQNKLAYHLIMIRFPWQQFNQSKETLRTNYERDTSSGE